ncbi:MAG TPA: hypothetical protein DCQ31_16445 [Bacteroidales bacterium]|nr:hypothetical protein [Bacteroidales bacterium]
MFKKSFLLSLSVVILLAAACKTPLSTVSVNNVKTLSAGHGDGIIYALPKNVLEIQVDVVKTTHIKGPFASFAVALLGTDDIISKNSSEYKLNGIRFKTFALSDENAHFLVETQGAEYSAHLNMNRQGILTGINSLPGESLGIDELKFKPSPNFTEFSNISYSDVMAKDFHVEAVDTIFRQVIKDSSYVRVPVLKKQIRAKNAQDQANEAAAFIVRLRKRRFKLVAGVYEKFYEGKALELALKELERQENEYVSLFTGKSFTEQKTFYFYHEPGTALDKDSTELFKFSKTEGVLPANSKTGLPVAIYPENPNISGAIQNYLNNRADNTTLVNGICYRMPAMCKFGITYDKKTIGEFSDLIAQKGSVLSLPLEYMKTGKYNVVFDPETGAMRSVKQLIPNDNNSKKSKKE